MQQWILLAREKGFLELNTYSHIQIQLEFNSRYQTEGQSSFSNSHPSQKIISKQIKVHLKNFEKDGADRQCSYCLD